MGSLKEFEAKIIMLGDTTVGKSTLIDCLINGPRGVSENGLQTTRGKKIQKFLFILTFSAPDNVYHNFAISERIVKTNIWDTVGQEKYKSVNKQFYNKAHGALLVADVSVYANEDNLHFWIQEFRKVVGPEACIILTGNKADKEQNTATVELLERFAQEYKIPFCLTSAALGTNVQETMGLLVNMIAEKFLLNTVGNDDDDEDESEDLKRTVLSTNSHRLTKNKQSKCCVGC